MPDISYFEREFNKDIQQKKRIGRGVFSMKGKRGYVGKLLTTMDLLTGKEKRDYIKSGDIKVTNVYNQLIPIDELETYTPETQKQIMMNWRENHTQKEIMETTGLNRSSYYRKLSDLGVIERPKWLGGKDKGDQVKKKTKSTEKPVSNLNIMSFEEFQKLSSIDQYNTLTEYYIDYTAKQIGEVWGKTDSGIHQIRYKLKNKLKKEGLFNQVESKENQTPTIQKQESFVLDESKEEIRQHEDDISAVSDIRNLLKSFQESIENQNQNIEMIKQDIFKIKNNDLPEKHAPKLQFFSSEKQEPEHAEEESNTATVSNMTLNFQDEKEGFLLIPEIERFISVLNKNPNNFKVNISLTRVDE